MEEKIDDKEFIALQGGLDKICDNWRDEFETRDEGKPDVTFQKELNDFLKSNWDPKKYKLGLVLAKKAWDDREHMRGIDLIPDDYRKMGDNGLQIITIDALHEDRQPGDTQEGQLFLAVPENRSVVSLIVRSRSREVLLLLPDEIADLRFVRKDFAEIKAVEPDEKKQDYGRQLRSIDEVEMAWEKADSLGVYLYVKLSDGRVMMVEKAITSPVQPRVKLVHYKNEGDVGEALEMGIFDDFLRLHPVIVDSEKVWEMDKKE